MSDLFISYASADRERVAALVQRFEQLGFSVWWDRDIAHGQNYHRVIQQALDQAKCAIVVWSQHSVNSEWVVNEASSARKRNALVPALIDSVEPPLEFRHLQTANLRDDNPNSDHEYEKLKRSVQQIVGGAARASVATQTETKTKTKSLWQTPVGWAVGAGALLIGATALLVVLKQLGWVGRSESVANQNSQPSAVQSSATTASTEPLPATANNAQIEAAQPVAAAQPAAQERVNLLDPEHGAQIVAAGEENWRTILETKQPKCSIISGHTFAIVGLRKEQPTAISTLAVYVDSEAYYNLKKLTLFAADAERGPFKKIDEFEIPNYKNMRAPFHEFKFQPVTTRFVKLQVANFYHGDGPNGNVCTMQLYGPQ
jgi:hypothetical protein